VHIAGSFLLIYQYEIKYTYEGFIFHGSSNPMSTRNPLKIVEIFETGWEEQT
jgi:hypothetical protein